MDSLEYIIPINLNKQMVYSSLLRFKLISNKHRIIFLKKFDEFLIYCSLVKYFEKTLSKSSKSFMP